MPRRAALVLTLAAALAGGPLLATSAQAADEPVVPLGDSAPAPAKYGPDPQAAATRLTAAAARAVAPVAAIRLPVTLDVRPAYSGQNSCDPIDKTGAVALGKLLVNTYRTGTFGISRWCNEPQSEHMEGRAVDWMLNAADPTQKAVADSARAWLTANSGENARRLGVMYLIFDKQMWRAYAPERGWQPYTGSNPHTDHIHISLTWDGAEKATSWWTGRAVTTQDLGPCTVYPGSMAPIYTVRRTGSCPATVPAPASPYAVFVPGQNSPVIKVAQAALGISADGQFGYGTRTAVLAYQAKVGLPRTGVLDKATWVKLVPAGSAPAPAPVPAPAPAPAPAPPTSVPPPAVEQIPAIPTTRFSAYRTLALKPGSTGMPVRVLQGGLGVKVTGSYDNQTARTVVALQKAWRLPATGRMDLKTWNRLDLKVQPWLGYLNTTLTRPATGPAVKALQQALRIGADGVFGAQTQAAVMTIQARYGLAANGVVTPQTWKAIAAAAPR